MNNLNNYNFYKDLNTPPYELFATPQFRGPQKNKKNKLNFKEFKEKTIHSLNDVEKFLGNFNTSLKYAKLYKLLKK